MASMAPPSSTWRARLVEPAFWRARLVDPVSWFVVVALALGLFTRLHAFNQTNFLLFDEHHFVENGRNYLRHAADWNDHPPLGKLLIALAIRVCGDNPLGWRLVSLLAGFGTMIVGGLAARRLFKDARAGWLTAALIACDGFTSAYSRVALLDGNLAFASAVALWLATCRPTWGQTIFAGLLAGFAASVKFSGGAVAIPLLVSLAVAKLPRSQKALRILAASGLAVAVYMAQFLLGLALSGKAVTPAFALAETARLFTAHYNSTEMKNPWVSGWPTWILPVRALVIGYAEDGQGHLRVLSGLGNLAVWWSAVGVGLGAFIVILRRGLTSTLGAEGPPPSEATESPVVAASAAGSLGDALTAFVATRGRGVALALSGTVAFLAPWVMTHRDSYIYHFLPCYVPLLVLLGGFSSALGRARPRLLVGWAVVILVVCMIYLPVWSFLPITPEGFRVRLFLPSWR